MRRRAEQQYRDTYGVTDAGLMTANPATTARSHLYRLTDQVNADSEPLTITGARGNAVLVGEDDWRAIQKTMHLTAIPGMAECIRAARDDRIDAGVEELAW